MINRVATTANDDHEPGSIRPASSNRILVQVRDPDHTRRLELSLLEEDEAAEESEGDGKERIVEPANAYSYYNISAVVGIAVGAILFVIVGTSKLNCCWSFGTRSCS